MENLTYLRGKLDFAVEIHRLKKEMNAVLLAHFYKSPRYKTLPISLEIVSSSHVERRRRRPRSLCLRECTSWRKQRKS